MSIRHIAGPPRAGALLCRLACQALKGAPWVRSYSVVQCVRRLMGQPLYSSAVDAGMLGERGYGDGSTLYMWLSSIALLPWLPVFPPQAFPTTISSHIPPVVLSMVNSSPRHRIPPQSLNSSSQLLPLPGNPHSCLGYVWLWQGLSVLIPFRLLQITCFTLSLKCFSSDSDSCPDEGIRPLL